MDTRFIETYLNLLKAEQQRQLEAEQRHYEAGKRDCKQGIYDKWYRYNTRHDGHAYDLGWMEQNATTKNDTVEFING